MARIEAGWRNGLGWVPPQGELGGVAPSGYTLYLNIFFTFLFLAQLAARFGKSGDGSTS
ncbi:MAG: hypothetical protein PVJ44_22925 [Desulfobacterales bacterium]